ncbi:MAG: DNA-directed RNA polymerase subunit beta, partial [Deltaproteobacteria bacterium]|nr:DNA-directed RNA polymerase subunit beta [Deltaproteobacteria bacterium]
MRVENLTLRKVFGTKLDYLPLPDLLELQKKSYEEFLQANVNPSERRDVGLQRVLKSIFPIKDPNNQASLEFVSYELEKPKYDTEECKSRGMSYVASLKVVLNLVLWEIDPETNKRTLSALKEDKVYFGEIPLMTDEGTFIINGVEKVVVSQLHRSPGVFFSHDSGKTHSSGKLLYSARIIPYRGSWLDFEFDYKDILFARIDKKRKFNATILLRALGLDREQILNRFYPKFKLKISKSGEYYRDFNPSQLEGQRAYGDIRVGDKVLVKKGQRLTKAIIKKLAELDLKEVPLDESYVSSCVIAESYFLVPEKVAHPKSKETLLEKGQLIVGLGTLRELVKNMLSKGVPEHFCEEIINGLEVIAWAGDVITLDQKDSKGNIVEKGIVTRLREAGVSVVNVLYTDDLYLGDGLYRTLISDRMDRDPEKVWEWVMNKSQEDSIVEIYKKIRPGDPARVETAINTFRNLFFSQDRYDLTEIGIYKINHKLYISRNMSPPSRKDFTLLPEDIIETVNYLLHLKAAVDTVNYSIDDIDHLGNRRVRLVGELVENHFRIAVTRLERAIREKMSSQDLEVAVPQELVNFKPVSNVLKEFFATGQLCQFLDQTNPLTEITHKRRLSALGPGGLTRDRAGFEVRDVHPSHYGRICPIETPEGQNIGLIVSPGMYATCNEYGFIQTPYRVVEKGRVTDKVVYLTALEEFHEIIAPASSWNPKKNAFKSSLIQVRAGGEYKMVVPSEITKLEVSPKQVISVSAGLIPFLEHDDANRALMGSNMQRQAVPCIRGESPVVGTGIELQVGKQAGAALWAKRSGKVIYVDATRITIKADKRFNSDTDTGIDIYYLKKFKRTNQDTTINHRPIVKVGDHVKQGEVIADSFNSHNGELALGQNVLVAFMPWHGFNFEDSILVSDRLLKQDIFTSVHIEEFECLARDTKLGREEITRDIPNIGEEALANLDETGIIRIGSFVKPGDILVGKVTPKGESQLTPEEKLLRAIFGEKAGEFKDSSLRVPPGVYGVVIDAQIYTRRGVQKDERAKMLEQKEIERLERDLREEIDSVKDGALRELANLVCGKKIVLPFTKGKIQLAKGTVITDEILRSIPLESIKELNFGEENLNKKVFDLVEGATKLIASRKALYGEKIKRAKEGDDLPAGIVKMVKVYIASKRKIQPGDKFAGRHGNKGVVSKIVPEEDMPFLEDGTPVDIVLNPLGVPSRMNVGQIFELLLGEAARVLGNLYEVPSFDEAIEEDAS